MENLISTVNKLQDCFASLGTSCPIDLPQIAVVGEQSSGKSSVLENFVGRDFLPRGCGIVTRRPLILQLINQEGLEYAEFLHLKGKKFVDFLQIRKEIADETDRVTGSNKNISSIPINLRIYSPYVLNLTLVDLPGLTKVPVGDQPKDIEQQIRDMIMEFIKSPNCLILAVTPAVIDLANSESLKLAKEVDPEGSRTIGVITKIDMMDHGTDCRDILNNKTYVLRRGYVGIVNRSQRDIDGKKDITSAQESEMNFFLSHQAYRSMANRLGAKFLQQTLSNQLSQHIKDSLPDLKEKIIQQMTDIEKEMDVNKELFLSIESPAGKTRVFMQKIQELSRDVDSILGFQHESIDLNELSSGTVISRILYQNFNYELSKVRDSPSNIKKEIRIAIQNTQGVRHTIFSADASFNAVVKKHIEKTRECCLKIVEKVSEEMRKTIDKCCVKQFDGYPLLLIEILSYFTQQLSVFTAEAKKNVNFLLDIQLSHINTNHPDFSAVQEKGLLSGRDNSETSFQSTPTTMENQVYKKGKLQLVSQSRLKSNKEAFFVLKGQNLYWYKDELENEIKNQITINGCRFKDFDSSNTSKRNYFTVYHKDGRALAKDMKVLELGGLTYEDTENWKAAFISAGVIYDRQEDQATSLSVNDEEPLDPTMIKQVEYVYLLVDTYVKIVSKIEQDVISKICVHSIVKTIRNIILSDLISHIYSDTSLNDLMKESDGNIQKRQEILNVYQACKKALSIVNSFMIKSDFTKDTNTSNGRTKISSTPFHNFGGNSEDNVNSSANNLNYMFPQHGNRQQLNSIDTLGSNTSILGQQYSTGYNNSSIQRNEQGNTQSSSGQPVRKPQRPPPRT